MAEPGRVDLWMDSHVFLGGIVDGTFGATFDGDAVRRPYELHDHAEAKLARTMSALDRVDVLTTLKRAADHRIRRLDHLYKPSAVPVADKPTHVLELLAFFGVIRPLMLGRLFELRNAVEHQDTNPPDDDECKQFAEFVWYFLRSTDGLASGAMTDIEAAGHNGIGGCNVSLVVDPPNLLPTISHGTISRALIADQHRPGLARVVGSSIVAPVGPPWEDHEDPVVHIRGGELRGPADVVVAFVRRYFEVARLGA